MPKQNLYAINCGVITLHVGDKKYPCTSIRITNALNKIPSASVTIGGGDLLSGRRTKTGYDDPEALLKTILSKHKGAYTDMLDCYITEDIQTGTKTTSTTIFKGVIATGAISYRAGTPTHRAVRLLCMHPVCRLFCNPVSMYTYFVGAAIVSTIEGSIPDQRLNTAANSNPTGYNDHIDMASLLTAISEIDNNKADISKLIAMVIDFLVRSSTVGLTTDTGSGLDGTETGVLDYITSRYRVDATSINQISVESYVKGICEAINAAVANGVSIFDALLKTITSDTFMLNLSPSFGDSFKLFIEPSAAWDTTTKLTIPAQHISSIDTTYNPIASINSPEAFIVQFNDAFSTQSKGTIANIGGQFGIYSVNDTVQEWAKNRYGASNATDRVNLKEYTPLVKTKISKVPEWLYASFAPPTTRESTNVLDDKRTPETPEDRQAATQQGSNSIPDITKCTEIADNIAKALFVHTYGIHDTAEVTLSPYLRFGMFSDIGCIENNIGKIVDIKFDNTGIDKALNLRGVIDTVSYTYSAEGGSQVAYTMKLRCVRPVTDDEPSIISPLYTRVTA